jgi:hypothetical protein
MGMKWANSGARRDAPDLQVEGMPAAPRARANAAVELQRDVAAERVIFPARGFLLHLGKRRM